MHPVPAGKNWVLDTHTPAATLGGAETTSVVYTPPPWAHSLSWSYPEDQTKPWAWLWKTVPSQWLYFACQ